MLGVVGFAAPIVDNVGDGRGDRAEESQDAEWKTNDSSVSATALAKEPVGA